MSRLQGSAGLALRMGLRWGSESGNRFVLASVQRRTSLKGKGKERREVLKNVTFYRCRKKGHVKVECPDGVKDDKQDDVQTCKGKGGRG